MWATGQTIDRFYLERVIGQGGFGMTFLARDTSQQPEVSCVIKTLKRDLKDFEQQQVKFRQEALNLAKCSHPHVVAVRDVIKEDGIWALVMDYVDGDNLATEIRCHPQEHFSEAEALRYIDQVGRALECVHERGLLHRDVKPLNIMIDKHSGNAVLIDFGLARDFSIDTSQSMTAMMTEGFAPIEQYDRRGLFGPYTDIYALAATLYCMLTGEPPLFNAKGRKEAKDKGQSIDNFMWDKLKALGVSEPVQKAIIWGMEIEVSERPQSVPQWLEALGFVVRSTPQPITILPERSRKPSEIPKGSPFESGHLYREKKSNEYIKSIVPIGILSILALFGCVWLVILNTTGKVHTDNSPIINPSPATSVQNQPTVDTRLPSPTVSAMLNWSSNTGLTQIPNLQAICFGSQLITPVKTVFGYEKQSLTGSIKIEQPQTTGCMNGDTLTGDFSLSSNNYNCTGKITVIWKKENKALVKWDINNLGSECNVTNSHWEIALAPNPI